MNMMYSISDRRGTKYPVLFKIQVTLIEGSIESEYLKYIQTESQSIVSNGDILLAPNAIFELEYVCRDKNNIVTICLRLNQEVHHLAYRGQFKHDALMRVIITEKEIMIKDLEGEELYEILQNVAGNSLIEQLEFCHCKFDNRIFMKMMEVFPTFERAKEVKFESCLFQDEGTIFQIAERIENTNILRINIQRGDVLRIFSNYNQCNNWMCLKDLSFDLGSSPNFNFTDKEIGNLCS